MNSGFATAKSGEGRDPLSGTTRPGALLTRTFRDSAIWISWLP